MNPDNNLASRSGPHEGRFVTEGHFGRSAARFTEDTMTKSQMVYSKFEKFEEQLAHCYFLLHERFIANPRLAKFWAETAMEELQHHSILRFCRERGLMADVDLDPNAAEHVEQLLDTVKSILSDPEVTIEEAFYASLLMETSELEDAYEKLTGVLAKDHRLLFEAIHASLRSHHSSFADAAEEFCADQGIAQAFKNLSHPH